MAEFRDLVGTTLTAIEAEDERVTFVCDDGRRFALYHSQDCCESVTVDDICGELADLLGSPILVAEESTSNKNPPGVDKSCQDSFTWTFYKLDTAKGGVTIRWYGESNGYYSESVDFDELTPTTHNTD